MNGCFNCGTSDTGAEAYVSLVNPMLAPNSAFPFTDIFRIGLDKQGFLGDISVPTRMLTNLYDQGSPFLGVMKNIPLTGGIGGINTIETNNQCNATCTDGSCGKGYYITFGQLTSVSDQGWRNFEQFPYTVSGQISTVSNEYVVSPSVPEGSIRVVIRWGAAEESQGANMRGYVYTRPNGAGDTSTSLLAGPVDTILHPDYLCKEAVVSGNASIPSGCSADQGMLYIHPETGLTNTFVQASTMNFGDAYSVSEEPLAFAVRNQDGPIAPWKNQTILVDVYTYHAGQTINSIFTPTFSYQIKTAASTSSNEGAQWWHVFTLVPKSKLLTSEIVNGSATDIEGTEYALVPIQSLETDDCEFHNNIYTNKIDCS